MLLEKVRIENFRTFKDETVCFDSYTCLVGANGAGKSCVLNALNVFFRNTSSSATNVVALSKEDFHHFDTKNPVRITLTFSNLSDAACEDLKHYVRQKSLIVSAQADWNDAENRAEVKQFGSRRVISAFSEFFKRKNEKASADELKAIYERIRENCPTLPNASSTAAREGALRKYEEDHPAECEEMADPEQFYGFTKGSNILGKYIQWVYVPAVKDASTEQDESSKSALGKLLDRTIRSRVSFKESIASLRTRLEAEYQELIDANNEVLTELQVSMERRLRHWSTPGAALELKWAYDPEKSLVVSEPLAKVTIGEDDFLGEVARLGHGMQRSFLIALLQELAAMNAETGPTLLLGLEEPELYQHPPQAQHLAQVLEELAAGASNNTQVIISTHSPYFVSSRGFERIRILRKHRETKCTSVRSTTYSAVEQIIADAVGVRPDPPTVTMAQVEQIMQPSQRELFFSRVAILVEGFEDLAFIATQLHASGRWSDFRRLGCHFITAIGKTNLSRPLAIANQLGIPAYVVFDADQKKKKDISHERDNRCLLRLCGVDNPEPFPESVLWHQRGVVWPESFLESVKADVGENNWTAANSAARKKHGLEQNVSAKNSMLVAWTVDELFQKGVKSQLLDRVCSSVLDFARNAAI